MLQVSSRRFKPKKRARENPRDLHQHFFGRRVCDVAGVTWDSPTCVHMAATKSGYMGGNSHQPKCIHMGGTPNLVTRVVSWADSGLSLGSLGFSRGPLDGAVLETHWRRLGALWAVWGPSWPVMGPSWAILGPSWAVLWPSRVRSVSRLGPFLVRKCENLETLKTNENQCV